MRWWTENVAVVEDNRRVKEVREVKKTEKEWRRRTKEKQDKLE